VLVVEPPEEELSDEPEELDELAVLEDDAADVLDDELRLSLR
jgi:hypothetical protein